MPEAKGHRWNFYRAGGVDQVVIDSGADLAHLDQLDPKLWVALACPTKGLELDARTLEYLDNDKDGRIRAPEVLSALRWLREVLKNLDSLFDESAEVSLDAIQPKTAAGKAVLAGARRILLNLGKKDAATITLDDVANTERIFADTQFNGDGIIPADAAETDADRQVIEDILKVMGSVKDRSGRPGIDQARADQFFQEIEALATWGAKPASDKSIMSLGTDTPAAACALQGVHSKIDDYFARCRLAAFDARAAAKLNREESEYISIAAKDLRLDSAEIAVLPLARIQADQALDLKKSLNPAWESAIEAFVKKTVTPIFGAAKTTLNEDEWGTLKAKLAPYLTWVGGKPATLVEKLGMDRVQGIAKAAPKSTIDKLLGQDKELEGENAQVESVHKLLLYHRDLVVLLRNFVSFADFYSKKNGIFQTGTLYLDGRSCQLCIRVDDAGKHASLATLARSYIAYCECIRPASGEKMVIAAAFTDGDSDHLMVGRNGIFFDRKGRDWDATITRIIDNPISIRQAFWAPYKRFVRMIEEQVAKRAGAAEDEATKKVEQAAAAVATADQTPKDTAKPPAKKVDVGTVAAIGVAIGGIATFLSSILATFFGLGKYMPIGIVALILAISGPSMLIAWLKLRQRNLGPILDANGWAVNGRVRINVPFGGVLTNVATLPPGSSRTLVDPYAERRRPWGFYITVLVILGLIGGWYSGRFDKNLPTVVRSVDVLGKWSWIELTKDKDEKPQTPTEGPSIQPSTPK